MKREQSSYQLCRVTRCGLCSRGAALRLRYGALLHRGEAALKSRWPGGILSAIPVALTGCVGMRNDSLDELDDLPSLKTDDREPAFSADAPAPRSRAMPPTL